MDLDPPLNPRLSQQRASAGGQQVLVFLERAGKIVFANAAARELLGLTAGDWIARPIEDVLWGLITGLGGSLRAIAESSPFRATLPSRTGRVHPIEGTYTLVGIDPREAIILAQPESQAATNMLRPESGIQRTAEEVSRPSAPGPQNARLMNEVIASLPEAIAVEHGEQIIQINPAFTQMFGFTEQEALGNGLRQLIVPETRFNENVTLLKAVNEQGGASVETVRVHKSGDLLDVNLQISPLVIEGARAGYIYSFRDIGERKETEARLQHDAMHDVLTGLPNRALFQDRLTLALSRRARRPDQSCGVLYLDLDKFKEINDTLGHAAGDVLLKAVSERLLAVLRPQDSAARLGGDEFAVLVENITSAADLEIVGNRVLKQLDQPFEVFGHMIRSGASIGAAMASPDHTSSELLIRDADYAMYRAKQTGGSRIEIYDRHLEVCVSTQQERERELRTVLENRLFEFWYQPIFRLTDGKLEGFETSFSWLRADGTPENSGDLMALAEETGLSVVLAREMLETACMQLRKWSDLLPQSDFYLSVNLTSRQFYNEELTTQLGKALAATGANPMRLVLEIPESVLNESLESPVAIIQRLVDCSVRVAMDEFGSGLAPLNHLVRLPLDIVKLDPRLSVAADAPGRQQALLETLVRLSRTVGTHVIAQGIETEDQLKTLLHLGCFAGQGPMLAGPMDESRAFRLAESRAGSVASRT